VEDDPNNLEPPLVTRVEPVAVVSIPQLPRPGIWESMLWCLVLLATQIAAAIVGVVLVMTIYALQHDNAGQFVDEQVSGLGKATAPSLPPEGRPPVPAAIGRSLAYGMLASQVASFLLIILVLPRRIGRDWKRQLAIRMPAGMHVFLVLMIVPGFMVVPGLIQEVYSRLTGMQPPATVQALKGVFQNVPVFITLLAVGVGPGVVEELWCRGFLGRGLCARFGLATGILLTSLFFAALHLDPSQLLVFILMGAYLHFVYLATRSIWMPILVHMLNNSFAVLAALFGVMEKLNANPLDLAPILFLACFALLLFGSIALWTSRARLEAVRGAAENWWDAPGWRPEYPGISIPPPEAASQVRIVHAAASPVAMIFTMFSFAVVLFVLFR
jgi:uncharacterized protein